MKAVCLHSKEEIEQFLRRNTFLHLYAIGDLDDFFWQYTTWYALKDLQRITQVALVYNGISLPVLLGISDEPGGAMRALLHSIIHLMPKRFYAHLSGDLAEVFAGDYRIQSHGPHYKMALVDKARLEVFDTSNVVPLTVADMDEIEALYRVSYPDNSFDPRMLETGCFYGIRHGMLLVSVAGIHVYSPRYRVAALGNVATHTGFRGQHLAMRVCAKLCQSLLQTIDHIGLNVKADNISAIHCYEQLGFACIAQYEEYTLELL